LAVVLGLVGIAVLGCRMHAPKFTVPTGGTLPPCPASPNCVCSQDPDPDHQIAPLTISGSPADAWTRLKRVVTELPRTRIAEEHPGYLRVEFTSRLMRFVDDVEFLMDSAGSRIHVRSASRVGYSDLGANHKRVEQLRAAMEQAGASTSKSK
jgi:uncharacterized protein (DUF1499 family)